MKGLFKQRLGFVLKCDGQGLIERLKKSVRPVYNVSSWDNPLHLARAVPADAPWQAVVGLLGPLPSRESIWVIIDYYSRFYEVSVLNSTTTDRIISAMSEIFARYGVPKSMKTDNGLQFRSTTFGEFLYDYGITHVNSPPQ